MPGTEDLNAKIIPLYTEEPGRVPDDATLVSLGNNNIMETGEIAVNLADRKIFSKDSNGDIVILGSGADSVSELADVVITTQPADDAFLVFDSQASTWSPVQFDVISGGTYGSQSQA